MADLTFGDQVWLSIIDKAALGTVIVLVGYVANRWLEGFKAQQALRGRIHEQQIPALAKLIQRTVAIANNVTALNTEIWQAAIAAVPERAALEATSATTSSAWLQDERAITVLKAAVQDRRPQFERLRNEVISALEDLRQLRLYLGKPIMQPILRSLLRSRYEIIHPADEVQLFESVEQHRRATVRLEQSLRGRFVSYLSRVRLWPSNVEARKLDRDERALRELDIDRVLNRVYRG